MKIEQTKFGVHEQRDVIAYTLQNDRGMSITCLNYGCIITKICTPDRQGNVENVVLGFDDLDSYESRSPYFGAIVGRVAGRIKDAEFDLDGKTYKLAKNDNGNHLHGGIKGFSHVIWNAKVFRNETQAGVEFTYTSMDGEEGYPGTLQLKVTYTLENDNTFLIHYQAQSNQNTLLNVTNHTYFNLSGNLKRDILHHAVKIDSDWFLELNHDLLPTGRMLDVKGTVFDMRQGRQIIEGIQSDDEQIRLVGKGYDHPFVLNSNNNREIIVTDEESGRRLVVETDTVGVVLYTSNQLSDQLILYGVQSKNYLGLCLETQGLPDAIHHPNFPSVVLKKDEPFSSYTKYKFEGM